MSKLSLLRETLREEEACVPERQACFIFQNWSESDEAVQARIRARIKRGEMSTIRSRSSDGRSRRAAGRPMSGGRTKTCTLKRDARRSGKR
jgi:hypothetical protein